jgi:DNA-binding IscR family transcriptional regulator
VKGGYSFGRPPEQITALEIVEQLDGPLGADAMGVFAEAAKAAQDVLRNRSIAEIAESELQASASQMYFI